MWDAYKKGYKAWLRLEKSLSDNSVEAYLHDVEKLTDYLQAEKKLVASRRIGVERPAAICKMDRRTRHDSHFAGKDHFGHP